MEKEKTKVCASKKKNYAHFVGEIVYRKMRNTFETRERLFLTAISFIGKNKIKTIQSYKPLPPNLLRRTSSGLSFITTVSAMRIESNRNVQVGRDIY